MTPTIFDKLQLSDIRSDPFPHAVLQDALPSDLCAALIANRPDSHPSKRPATRTVMPAWMLRDLDFVHPVWREFARAHSDASIARRVRDLFGPFWPDHLPALPEDDAAYGLHGKHGHDTHPVLCDARLETISPNPDETASHRRQHLDNGNRLFSALFYLRAPEDDSTDGGLTLFRFRRTPERLDVFEFDDRDVEAVVTVPYAANTLVLFPNRPDAIHGAQPRRPTRHDRAYVFVTAEVEKTLF